jgi:O-glycosyl hydrolase
MYSASRGEHQPKPTMKMKLSACSAFVFCLLVATSNAVPLVEFDSAHQVVSNSPSGNSDVPLNTFNPVVTSRNLSGYTGEDVYGAVNQRDGGAWTVGSSGASGLRIRMGSSSSNGVDGLFLFKITPTSLDEYDILNASSIHISSMSALDSAQLRFVIRDAANFYISDPSPNFIMGASNVTGYSIRRSELQWYDYDPVSTAAGVSVIGAAALPSFANVDFIGFTLFADGSTSGGSVNFGVRKFVVEEASDLVDTDLLYQKMEGFGAAGAWYQNRLDGHDSRNDLIGLIFRDLGLDIYRLRNVYDKDGYAAEIAADFGIVKDANLSKGTANSLRILITSWSPPGYLKSNGVTGGPAGSTLASDANGYRYQDFATWWADGIDYYTQVGINPYYISVQNEPNWHPDYEGCGMSPVEDGTYASYAQAFETTWQELSSRFGTGMPKMIGPETIGFNGFESYIDNLIDQSHMYGYAHHYYQGNVGVIPDALNELMGDIGQAYGYKPLFQSEFAHLQVNTNTDIVRKLNLARLIYNSLTIEWLSAYFYWDLFWGDTGGLVNLPDLSTINIKPEYYALKHYSAFIHADWDRVAAHASDANLDVSAFTSPDATEVSVVIVNATTAAAQYDPQFDGFTVASGSVYRSTDTMNCEYTGVYLVGSSISIPAESITTLALLSSAVPANNPPVFVSGSINETDATDGVVYSAQLFDDSSDPDGDPMIFSLVSGPAWLRLDSLGYISGNPASSDIGPNSWSIQVIDGKGGSDAATLNITVSEAPNQLPVWSNNPFTQGGATEDSLYSDYINWRVTDAEGDTLTYAIVSGPSWLVMGNAAYGRITGTPMQANVGDNVFVVSVSDGINPAVEATMVLPVANVNAAPVFSADPLTAADATEGAAYSGNIGGSASDVDGDALTYSKVSGPAWLSLAADGTLTGTPASGDVGANSFTVQVDDANGGSDTATLNITVEGIILWLAEFVEVDFNDFESGWGIWNDGGRDARRNAGDAAYSIGTYSIRIQDNTSSSTMTTDDLALSGQSEVKFEFSYYAGGMESGEDFWLQISTDGGSSYTTVGDWISGVEFNNGARYYESVTITGFNLNDQTRLRLRCDASANNDKIYVDEVRVSVK